MANLGSFSFRRILLARLLLVTVPVLLLGVIVTYGVTYRKARSALLETARQNLTESSVRKARLLNQSIEALKLHLSFVSHNYLFQATSSPQEARLLTELKEELPPWVKCLQLVEAKTFAIKQSTCGKTALNPDPMIARDPHQNHFFNKQEIQVKVLLPRPISENQQTSSNNQLELLFNAPIYDQKGSLRYLLLAEVILQDRALKPGSLTGYLVIINQQGMILAHPWSDRIGHNIKEEADGARLESLMRNALAGKQDFLHLFSFDKDGAELLAGYTSIPSPIPQEKGEQWVILAVTRLDDALSDLDEIRRTLLSLLLGLTLALILASSLGILYLAREMSKPLEILQDYALNEDYVHSQEKLPRNFKIHEFNQLTIALNQMIKRLKSWGQELENAWEEAKVANQFKTDFLRIVSHELRTPLNGIINAISFLKDELYDTEEEKQEELEIAYQSTLRLLGIVNELLTISKIEKGQLNANIEQVSLSNMVADVFQLVSTNQQDLIKARGLNLKLESWPEEIIVYADPVQLKQVLINVIDNGIKFTKKGQVVINIQVQSLHKNSDDLNGNGAEIDSPTGQKAVIQTIDTGIGIEQEQQKLLFRPFVMVDSSLTREEGGIGLGLAISQNLIKMMGGSIRLFSEGRDRGTTVEICLPTAKVSQLVEN